MPASCTCGRRWTGLNQAHCSICHAHFGSVKGFDRHQPSYDGCLNPAQIVARTGRRIFRSDDGPLGDTWVLATDRVHPQHAKRMAEKETAA